MRRAVPFEALLPLAGHPRDACLTDRDGAKPTIAWGALTTMDGLWVLRSAKNSSQINETGRYSMGAQFSPLYEFTHGVGIWFEQKRGRILILHLQLLGVRRSSSKVVNFEQCLLQATQRLQYYSATRCKSSRDFLRLRLSVSGGGGGLFVVQSSWY